MRLIARFTPEDIRNSDILEYIMDAREDYLQRLLLGLSRCPLRDDIYAIRVLVLTPTK